MDCRRKLPIRLLLKILAYIAYESSLLQQCIDLDAVLVCHFESGDRVLQDQRKPWNNVVS
jgi:hypothetical protein